MVHKQNAGDCGRGCINEAKKSTKAFPFKDVFRKVILFYICISNRQSQQFPRVIMSLLSMKLNKSNLWLSSNSWFKEQIEFIEHFIRAFLVASHLRRASFDLYTVINQIARAREHLSKKMETYLGVISYSGDWSVSYFFISSVHYQFHLYILSYYLRISKWKMPNNFSSPALASKKRIIGEKQLGKLVFQTLYVTSFWNIEILSWHSNGRGWVREI